MNVSYSCSDCGCCVNVKVSAKIFDLEIWNMLSKILLFPLVVKLILLIQQSIEGGTLNLVQHIASIITFSLWILCITSEKEPPSLPACPIFPARGWSNGLLVKHGERFVMCYCEMIQCEIYIKRHTVILMRF